jgi:hypothetical protein
VKTFGLILTVPDKNYKFDQHLTWICIKILPYDEYEYCILLHSTLVLSQIKCPRLYVILLNFCSVLSVDNFWPSLTVLVPHAAPRTLITNKPQSQQTCLASNLSTGTQAMVPLIIFPAKISVHTSKMGFSLLLWPVHHACSCKCFYSLSKTPSRFFAS